MPSLAHAHEKVTQTHPVDPTFLQVAVESERPSAAGTGGCEELRFKLSMKPRYGENRDYISLYVHNLNRRDLKYSLNFALLSADHERRQARRADTRVHAPNESWGFPKFCQRSEVVDKASQVENKHNPRNDSHQRR